MVKSLFCPFSRDKTCLFGASPEPTRASDSLGIRKPCVVVTSVAALVALAAAGEVVAVVAWNGGTHERWRGKL